MKNSNKSIVMAKHTNGNSGNGVTVVNPKLFFRFNWFNHLELAKTKSDSYWEDAFKESVFVHYYESSSRGGAHGKGFPTVLRPNKYGKEKPALAYFGPRECPMSFYSTTPF